MINRIHYPIRQKSYQLIAILLLSINTLLISTNQYSELTEQTDEATLGQQEYLLYLPILFNVNVSELPTVNIPNIRNHEDEFLPEEAAVFWFGKVTPTENYTDVRIGFDQSNLWVHLAVFDRRLWYDPSPTPGELTNWDAVSLYLNTDSDTYRFDGQLNWWETRDEYQASYQRINGEWILLPIFFTTDSIWWGFPAPNDDQDDRAWAIAFTIPFQSLGFTGQPPEGTEWRLGVQLHDRDDLAGTPIPDKYWPAQMLPDYPVTWGLARFGLPGYTPPHAIDPQAFNLRNGLNGVTVVDGMVGGGTLCGTGLDFWSQWGYHSYPGARDVNVQNQGNTDDWPCFSKIYVTFPLDSLPRSREVITATLTLHQSGNSTGFPSDPPKALNSLIQVWQINRDWNPITLTWNNAPEPIENLSRAWVGSIEMPDLGIARIWDVSIAAARAYTAGEPLRMVLYSADFYGPHGKYFFSSNSIDYNGVMRPSLKISIGSP